MKREALMETILHVVVTAVIMIIVSVSAVRLVDATVQIDGDYFLLALFLAAVNMVIGLISYTLYRINKQRNKV